jgi:hypothetical protein
MDGSRKERKAQRFCYVLLVMKGDNYIPGALVTAYSLRLTGTKHDLVCMITDDVSGRFAWPCAALSRRMC